LANAALRRHASELRAVCANQRPYGSVRGVPGNRYPYRDRYPENQGWLPAERFPLKAPVLMSYTWDRSADMPVDWKDHIASDPEILRGKPRIKGTRIPVGLVLGYLAAGQTAEEIIAEFPDLTRDQIAACLDYARDLAEFAVEA